MEEKKVNGYPVIPNLEDTMENITSTLLMNISSNYYVML
jgi:hypothetical protein